MGFPKSGAPAGNLAFGLMVPHAISSLDRMARSSRQREECRLRSMLHATCQNLAFPDHSGEKAGIRCSPCSRYRSRIPCSSVSTAIRMLSSSRLAGAHSLNSNRIWPARVLSGAWPVANDLTHYRQLERRLWMTRWRYEGQESPEEDAILNEMEGVWMNLNEGERALLRLEGPRWRPTESSSLSPQLADTMYAPALTPWAYEGFHSPAEAILSADAA